MRDRRDLRIASRAARDQTWELPFSEIVRRHGRVLRPFSGNTPRRGRLRLRLEFATERELASAIEALQEIRATGLGTPYVSGRRLVQPIYGRASVMRLLRIAWGPEADDVAARHLSKDRRRRVLPAICPTEEPADDQIAAVSGHLRVPAGNRACLNVHILEDATAG